MKCKHDLRSCRICHAPGYIAPERTKIQLVNLTRINPPQREHLLPMDKLADKVIRPEKPIPNVSGGRMDKVSDRRTKNTPKPHDPLDVIDRACFTFRKNTRAPK